MFTMANGASMPKMAGGSLKIKKQATNMQVHGKRTKETVLEDNKH